MHKILHVMNNNIVLAEDYKGMEIMLVGKGIGFNKKQGDIVTEKKVEKTFYLKTKESKENFISLLRDVPLDFITVTYEIIDRLTEKYNFSIQEYIYVTLTDHIYCSYQALKKGNYKFSNLPDASKEYPVPYKMALEALDNYRENLFEYFPDDEISRIAYHFMNAEREEHLSYHNDFGKRKNILNIIDNELKRNHIKRTKENSNFYDRFMIHLNYLLDYSDENNIDDNSLGDLDRQIELAYPKAYKIGCNIYDIITSEMGINLLRNEKGYLAIHIQRLL